MKMSLRGARVEIHAEHYDKLRRLFTLNAGVASYDKDTFESAAFAMLCRYTAGLEKAALKRLIHSLTHSLKAPRFDL